MKFIKLLLVLLLFMLAIPMSIASDIPVSVMKRLEKEFPGASVRFDAMVELPDRTQYLPVFPLELKKIDGYAQVVKTYPRKKRLQQKPDMILFNNNFALLKIIKDKKNNPTVIYYDKMPLCIKLGLLPQDLLVPENLVLPEGLEVLLGNLVIPINKDDDEFEDFKDFDKYFDAKKARELAAKKVADKKLKNKHKKSIFKTKAPELVGKIFYSINFYTSAIEIINPDTGRIEYTIPLKSKPSDFIQTPNKRYLLASLLGSDNLSVIDLMKNEVVKEVSTGLSPGSIVLDRNKNIAYIANQKSSTISIFDLHHMDRTEDIKVPGCPTKLSLSYDRKSIIYLDASTNKLYMVTLTEDFAKKEFIMPTKNLSKAIKVGQKIYVIYRDKSYMEVIDIDYKKCVKQIAVGEKPIDIKVVGSKAYILNAGSDSLSVIDLNVYENIKEIPLKTDGFPCRITILDSQARALITTAAGHEYILFDVEKDKIIDRLPVQTNINKVIISRMYQK